MSPMFSRWALRLVLVAAVGGVGSAAAGPFTGMVVFGDSLSDSGNNAAAGLYDPAQVVTGNTYVPSFTYGPAATYSNGSVWASYAAATLGISLTPSLAGGTNFAMGGATTGTPGSGPGGFPFSLMMQVGAFSSVAQPPAMLADVLFVVAGGGNNARRAMELIAAPGADVPKILSDTADSFAADSLAMVQTLQLLGAQHIVVWNVPDLGLAPAVGAGGPPAIGLGNLLASMMNAELSADLAGMGGVQIFDLFGFGHSVDGDPAAFGMSNVKDACGAVSGADCDKYAYWDGIHPTTALHRALAKSVLASVGIPEPGAFALAALALFVLGASRVRTSRIRCETRMRAHGVSSGS